MRALAPTEIIAQIASRSGVHVSTVWRALADDKRISEATRLRVRRQADRLNYRPNRIARQLATGKSRMIGLVTPPLTSESHQKKINALFGKVHAAGYDLLLRTVAHDVKAERAAIADLRSHRAEGLILMTPVGMEKNAHLRELETENVPFVLFDSPGDLAAAGQTSVSLDRFAVVQASVDCLLQHGHRNIAYLFPMGTHASPKLEAYLALMRRHGLEPRTIRAPEDSSRYVFGYRAVRENRPLFRDVTGLVAHCDRVAMGALRGLHEAEIGVPDEVSVIGFDNDDVGEVAIPPLTSVAHPIEEMTTAAVDLLLERIRHPEDAARSNRSIPPRLVLRGSVGTALRFTPPHRATRRTPS